MGRSRHSVDLAEQIEGYRAQIEAGQLSQREVAAELGISRSTFSDYFLGKVKKAAAKIKPREQEVPFGYVPPFEHDRDQVKNLDTVRPIEELIAQRRRVFELKARAEEQRYIDVRVNVRGPIGILHFGDPHVDDDGCDIDALIRHVELVNSTPGLFAGNVGDTRNNWIGRLARLWAEQSTSAAEAAALLEWFVKAVDWLYLIGGNHDAWSGADDPIAWIQKERSAIYTPSECRLRLAFPNGRECYINARHDFTGHSMWNPAHGVGRAVQQGQWDDISVCGHRHVSGYMPLVAPDGRVCHAVQVASYKTIDRYAKEKGFRNQTIEPAVVTVIDPDAQTPASFVSVFLSVEEGVDYLNFKRRARA